MQTITLWQLQFWPKSKHKAWEGLVSWKYKFFTSSDTQSKFLDSFDFEWPALVFGTWWKASVHYCEQKFATSTDCYSLTTDDKNIFLKYIYSYLRGNMYLLEEWFKWAGLEHISKDYLKQIQIPLPSLVTQRAIADKLDKLQSLIDLKKQAIAKTDDLAKSIFLEMFGDPMTNEKGWEVKVMKNICNKITDWTHDTPERLKEWVMFITWKNIRPFEFDLSDLDYVSQETHDIIYQRCNPEFEDVLYTNIWVNMGTAVLNKFKFPFSMKNVALFKPNKNMLLWSYLEHLLNFKQFKVRLLWNNWKGWAQWFLSLDILRKLEIPLPPLPLQQKFADIITKLESTKEKNKQSLAKLEDLYQSEMQRSFKL